MTKIESILEEARALSNVEQRRLAEMLLALSNQAAEIDEVEVGERGLAAWIESTRSEDWSPYYPSTLRQAGS